MVEFANRVMMTTATVGTGTITLGSAVAGMQAFTGKITDGGTVRYVIEEGNNWEIGLGVYTDSGTTLTRTPSESSSGGSAISLAGNARVMVTQAANDIATVTGVQTLTNKTLTDPNIDGALEDNAGADMLVFNPVGSAVNQFTMRNAATAGAPRLSATGSDTNIDLELRPKGTGIVDPGESIELRDSSGSRRALIAGSANGLDINVDPANALGSSRLRLLMDNTEITRLTPTGFGIFNTSPAFPLDITGAMRASTGILFGTDTAADNTLDDYEEGTWTVTLFDAATGGNASATTVSGNYTKIGNIVHAAFGFLNNIDTTGMNGGGTLHIALPFAAASGSGNTSAGSIHFGSLTFPASQTIFTPAPATSGGRARVLMTGSGQANSNLTVGALTTGTTDIVAFQFTYRV